MKILLFLVSFMAFAETRYVVSGAEVGHTGPVTDISEYIYNSILDSDNTLENSGEGALPDKPFTDANKTRIGAENRTQASYNAYPYSAVAKVTFCVTPSECGYSCTGWRVGKRLLMLNGHCVYNKTTKKFHTGYQIDFGFNNGTYVQRAYPDYNWVATAYQSGTSGVDWGALRLPATAPNYTGWFGYRNYSTSWNNLAVWKLSGYGSNWTAHPFNTNFQGVHHNHKVINKVYDGRALFHEGDSGQGNSGSPVFGYWTTGGWYTVGTNYGGWGPRDDNRMMSCSPIQWGVCGNVATDNSVYGTWITQRRNEGL